MFSFIKALLAKLVPHDVRQSLKHRLFVVRDMHTRLANLKSAGFVVSSAIDGGSYRGDWARELWKVWPSVPVMMVEPQPSCRNLLETVALCAQGSKVASNALGANEGIVELSLSESNSGIRPALDETEESVKVAMRTLDTLCAEWVGMKPNFLKLDLQGYELEALRGATQMLINVEVLLIEISVLRIGEVPVFREVDRYLEEIGFRMYDVIPQYYRPRDNALWQVDAFYVKETSPLIASRSWS
jgi:FkbM family methyltransferase